MNDTVVVNRLVGFELRWEKLRQIRVSRFVLGFFLQPARLHLEDVNVRKAAAEWVCVFVLSVALSVMIMIDAMVAGHFHRSHILNSFK